MDLRGIAAAGPALPEPPAPAEDARARAAAQEFEAMFLGQMANEMLRGAMPETMNGGFGEEMFRNLLGDEIGRQMARSGGIGLSDQVYHALLERGDP